MEFVNEKSLKLFRDNVSANSWFSQVIQASLDFVTEGIIDWAEIEGIPLKIWSDNTFKRIAAKWGELLDIDDHEETCFHSKRLCILTKDYRSISEDFKIFFRGKETGNGVNSDAEEVPETAVEEKGQEENNADEESLEKTGDKQFEIPPGYTGYTPIEGSETSGINKEDDTSNNYEKVNEVNVEEFQNLSGNGCSKYSKEVESDSIFFGRFKKSKGPTTGGSILNLLDEVVKVGQVMGYKMDGCMSNMVEIIESQGAEERYLSDHRPILLRESYFDYGPTPFRFFHYWSDLEGFGNMVEAAWKEYPNVEQNAMTNMMGKLKHLKKKKWNIKDKQRRSMDKDKYKVDLEALDTIIDQGNRNEEIVKQRSEIVSKLLHIDKLSSMEFFNHFRNMFDKPDGIRVITHMEYPRRISLDKQSELEGEVSNDEIKRVVWDCGTDKAPGPDGFTFGFYRRFWYLVDNDVYAAVKHLFIHGKIPKGCNSSFIA
nr:RNA-directed DNA polymerase, eukaryota [Tanacetum cinerariifolium]GEY98060.1 RNA-directed DNA polymerase, eukaryota [Tanacetum cinerariifolium]GEY98063.1 RNA-directed DNA polymerase, eukaryota [Tanacetum cinerariifolium]